MFELGGGEHLEVGVWCSEGCFQTNRATLIERHILPRASLLHSDRAAEKHKSCKSESCDHALRQYTIMRICSDMLYYTPNSPTKSFTD